MNGKDVSDSHRGKFPNKKFTVIAAVTNRRTILAYLPHQMDSLLFRSLFSYILIFTGHENFIFTSRKVRRYQHIKIYIKK